MRQIAAVVLCSSDLRASNVQSATLTVTYCDCHPSTPTAATLPSPQLLPFQAHSCYPSKPHSCYPSTHTGSVLPRIALPHLILVESVVDLERVGAAILALTLWGTHHTKQGGALSQQWCINAGVLYI